VREVAFHEDESSTTFVTNERGEEEAIHARFIIDASGYGRVIPRQLGLDRASSLEPRKAVFAHMEDPKRDAFDEPHRIVIVMFAPGVWTWIIPFSSGKTSVGFVGPIPFFEAHGKDVAEQFRALLSGHPYLKARFEGQPHVFEPRSLQSWSATTDQFYGHGYVLTGNVTEFLDPIFSSGVMFATVSAQLASQLVVKKLGAKGAPAEPMTTEDWEREYTRVIRQGVDTFRTYVTKWYDGTVETLFFAKNPPPEITRQICSVLAGYVWDQSNPFVANHEAEVTRTARIIRAMAKAAPPA
jgi:flavin-dependent dehydrogenase